jgi:hypothetical protein
LWWSRNDDRFPRAAAAARVVLCIPATSAPAERIFSCAGVIDTVRRTRLTSDMLEKLVVLRVNENNVRREADGARARALVARRAPQWEVDDYYEDLTNIDLVDDASGLLADLCAAEDDAEVAGGEATTATAPNAAAAAPRPAAAAAAPPPAAAAAASPPPAAAAAASPPPVAAAATESATYGPIDLAALEDACDTGQVAVPAEIGPE